jgi:hypothetical protein
MRYHITGIKLYLHERSTSPRMEMETERWRAYSWFGKEYTSEENEMNSAGAETR